MRSENGSFSTQSHASPWEFIFMISIGKSTYQAEITSPTLPRKSSCVFLGHPTFQRPAKLRMQASPSQAWSDAQFQMLTLKCRIHLYSCFQTSISRAQTTAWSGARAKAMLPSKVRATQRLETVFKNRGETKCLPSQQKLSSVRQPWS